MGGGRGREGKRLKKRGDMRRGGKEREGKERVGEEREGEGRKGRKGELNRRGINLY